MDLETKQKIASLEDVILSLQYEVAVIKKIISVNELPQWSVQPLERAYKCGMMLSPYGESIDLCRMLALLDSLKILSK